MWKRVSLAVLTIKRVQVYLACNTAVPTELIGKMNAALRSMVRDGTMQRIDRRYQAWVEPRMPLP